jgi:3-oxoacyl-(acyl-carrier-protein) synthase
MESRCIREIFYKAEEGPRVSAVSSFIGNPIGAAGGIQGVVSALALDTQTIPPHAGIDQPDIERPVRLMGMQPESIALEAVMQNSYCFMGKHSSLTFKHLGGGHE